jgi:hypothetical protein
LDSPVEPQFLVALPGIAAPILAFFELRHSAEANKLRAEANNLRGKNNELTEQLDTERNDHLQQIAANTKQQRGLWSPHGVVWMCGSETPPPSNLNSTS